MLTIPARTVYIDPAVYAIPACRARLERVLPHVACQDIRPYDEAGRAACANVSMRRHGKDDFGDDAILIFTTFEESRRHWYYHWRDEAGTHGGACQTALELNLVNGCVFRCAYCGFGRLIHFSLDVERFMDGLDAVFAEHPRQRLFKYSNMTDLPPFEPELDAIPPLVRRFATEAERYLMLFTKSDNVDFLANLDHRGHTIISWSISAETPSRLVDKRTPPLGDRLDAMRRMQAAGYPVRARLSPIVPVKNWRAEYRDLFERLFAACTPDVVTLELLGWMGVNDLLQILPRELLDDDAVAQAEAQAPQLAKVGWGPFSQATHEEVYRFCIETVNELSPTTPVSTCHGTPATWHALGPLMRQSPDCFVCNCGPQSTPGGEVYERFHATSR